MNNGWLKLPYSLLDWQWYDHTNTLRVFIHIILSVNRRDRSWHGITLPRGSLATSRQSLSSALGLSQQEVRTALSNLRSTGDISIQTTNRYSIITLCSPMFDDICAIPSDQYSTIARPSTSTTSQPLFIDNKIKESNKNQHQQQLHHQGACAPKGVDRDDYLRASGGKNACGNLEDTPAAEGRPIIPEGPQQLPGEKGGPAGEPEPRVTPDEALRMMRAPGITAWLDDVAIRFHQTRASIDALVADFHLYCQVNLVEPKPFNEFRKHFVNWLPYELRRRRSQPGQSLNSPKSFNPSYSKPSSYAITSFSRESAEKAARDREFHDHITRKLAKALAGQEQGSPCADPDLWTEGA